MVFHQLSKAVLAASCLLASLASAETTNTMAMSTPTAQPTNIRALQYIGCFATTVPFVDHGPYIYQTSGNCQQVCLLFGNSVLGLGNGTHCWCADAYPPADTKVDDSQCSTPCAGYGTDMCGSGSALSVYNTGYSLNSVSYWSASSTASSTSITAAPQSSSSASSTPKSSGGHGSTVGIVVGVIVGLVALSGLAGAGFFFLRRRQQQEMEDYRRQNDVKSFVGTSAGSAATNNTRPQMWAPDNRMDTTAGRRISNGSIADNEDFSRRILQVRNPDGNGF